VAALFEALAVTLFFTAVAVFATWPLARHPLGGFYGFGNDNWGGIPYFGWLHDATLGPGDPSFDPELQAPFGLDIPDHAVQPMDRLFSLLFGGFEQGLGGYNLQIFTSFVLAGCTMYLLGRYVTGSRLAALVAGFAFTFSPFHLSLAMQYNALASIQWIPLFLLALLVLLQRGRKRDAVLTGAAFALVVLTSYYYAWYIGWFTALVVGFFAARLGLRRRREGQPFWPGAKRFLQLAITRGAIGIAVAVAIATPFLVSSAQGAARAGSENIEHPISESVRYSARPWMLFVPPHDNPLVGERVRPWITQHLFESPIYEQSIYLGYTLLLLAAVALWGVRRDSVSSERARFARGLLVAGIFAGLLIMLGPYFPLERSYWRQWSTPDATAHLPSLSWLMFELAPIFRFFTRAFVLVSACLCLLAAIGFARLERLARMTPALRAGLTGLVLGLIALEFSNAPPHVWFSAQTPAWVSAVRSLPSDATVVDYPIAPAFSPRANYYMFWQTKHRRRTANPQVDPEAQALAGAATSPDDPASGQALHGAGIDYAIVHTALPPQTRVPYQPQLPDDSMPADSGASNPWFRAAARTPDAVIYRVLDTPRRVSGALVRPGDGFGSAEQEGAFDARWLQEPTGELTLFVTGRPRRSALMLELASFAQPRRVTVSLDGRRLASFPVAPGGYVAHRVSLGKPAAGRHVLRMTASPGPQSIQATTGVADPRSIAVRLREPVLVVPAGAP
jgi:hypothetical protein